MSSLASNKQALHDYEVLEEFEAGIVLSGWEVKSAKSGKVSLKESFVSLRGGEAFLLNAHFGRWPGMGESEVGIETRERKLLLNKSELDKLRKGVSVKGNTVIALNMHLGRNSVKLKIALARGRKSYDKRQKLKEKDMKRSLERDLKQYRIS